MYEVKWITLAGELQWHKSLVKETCLELFRSKCADETTIFASIKGPGVHGTFNILAQ